VLDGRRYRIVVHFTDWAVEPLLAKVTAQPGSGFAQVLDALLGNLDAARPGHGLRYEDVARVEVEVERSQVLS